MKLLGIAGSPRRGGNTDRLLDEAIAGAAGKGAQIKQIVLSDLEISPCRHCDSCAQNSGRCIIEDDMQWIYNDLIEFDRFIFASPVFFMGVTAQSKAMIDRCQAFWVLKYRLKLPISRENRAQRKGVFISVGGTKYNNLFEGSIATVKSWYRTLDIFYADDLLIPNIDSYDAITEHPLSLKRAFSIGQELAI